jgi:hypothetical protein
MREQQFMGLKEVRLIRESLNEAQKRMTRSKGRLEKLGAKLKTVGVRNSEDTQEVGKLLVEAEKELAKVRRKVLQTRAKLERAAPPEIEEVACRAKDSAIKLDFRLRVGVLEREIYTILESLI